MKREKEILSLAQTLALIGGYWCRQRKLLLIGGVLGVCLGIAINLLPKSYLTSFTIESSSVPANLFSEAALRVNAHIDHGQFGSLAESCSCDSDVFQTLGLIQSQIFEIVKTHNSSINQIRFTFQLKDPQYTNDLQNCLLEFFMSNDYISTRANAYVNSRKKITSKLKKEILQLDSFQRSYYSFLEGKKPLPMGVYANGSHSEMSSLVEKVAMRSEEIELGKAFYLVSEVTVPTKPTLGLVSSLLIGFSIGALLSFMLSLYFEAKLLVSITDRHDEQETQDSYISK